MLSVSSVLSGFTVAASDGPSGAVKDFLFDDDTWTVRWLVVDMGSWLFGRTVLVNASALGEPDSRRKELPVRLTKAQIEAGPNLAAHQPVSRQAENGSYQYYGAGYHLVTGDEAIGRVWALVMDNANWDIRYFEADTGSWWNRHDVVIAPVAIKTIEYRERQFVINITRSQAEASPRLDSIGVIGEDYERKLHGRYGWPGYWYYPK